MRSEAFWILVKTGAENGDPLKIRASFGHDLQKEAKMDVSGHNPLKIRASFGLRATKKIAVPESNLLHLEMVKKAD